MDELEEKLNAVLNNPSELEKISKIASAIMGGSGDKPEEPPQEPDIDMGMLKQMLSGLRGNGGKKRLRRGVRREYVAYGERGNRSFFVETEFCGGRSYSRRRAG